MYSFGVLVWEIFTNGLTPFAELQAEAVPLAVMSKQKLPWPNGLNVPEEIRSLVQHCMQVPAAGRPTMAELSGRIRALLASFTAVHHSAFSGAHDAGMVSSNTCLLDGTPVSSTWSLDDWNEGEMMTDESIL